MTAHLNHFSDEIAFGIDENTFDGGAANIETGVKDWRRGHDQGEF
jgi:hypothetical protein